MDLFQYKSLQHGELPRLQERLGHRTAALFQVSGTPSNSAWHINNKKKQHVWQKSGKDSRRMSSLDMPGLRTFQDHTFERLSPSCSQNITKIDGPKLIW